MQVNKRVDLYVQSLPEWQRRLCQMVRELIHEAAPNISEEIKFTNRPYFTYKGNVCAILATKDHVNIFIYDPMAPDPEGLINQGKGNSTARAIQVYQNQTIDKAAFIELIQTVVANNEKGGWRKLKKVE
ncbi:MAG TPA: DUF1801 domain-containing protein [Candidatus Saccharimonadia bacterium]|nr:DUF1801 domain-containing protein [Candidatus Saccharimonadia bacterium]